MKRIRGGSGLGDSVYLRPIVDHFVRTDEVVQVCSDYPDIFIGSGADVQPFGRNNINVLGHYVAGKSNPNTNQWQDVCNAAHVGALELKFEWQVINWSLVDDLRTQAGGRSIVLIHGGRAPMGRTDGFGAELLPDCRAFNAALFALKECLTVQVGKADQIYRLKADVDLNGATSVSDLLDIASICDGWLAQCSFAVPLAECFDKPLLAVWASRGLAPGRHAYIQQITPQKVLSKPTSHFVVDDWPTHKIREAALALCYF